jgi:DNA-binding NarL/FixJ family response regulator
MKVLVTDDHVLIRESLRGVLRELKPEAASAEKTITCGRAYREG